jgi:uncharacterized protein
VDPATAARLDRKLWEFEQQTGHQVLVAVYRKLPSPSLEDFTVKAAQSWKVGGKKLDTGAVWFVFAEDRKMRLEVGYGLEPVIPDVIAKRILADTVAPRLRTGDWAGALEVGTDAILAAARQEPGSPRPAPAARATGSRIDVGTVIFIVIVMLFLFGGMGGGGRRSRTYGRRGWSVGPGPWIIGGGGGGFGGGFGGGGGGGWGGFSGGGGSFGGGGASADW